MTADWTATALAYLRERVELVKRGKINLTKVAGSVRAALASGVSLDDVVTLLGLYGLCWEPDSKTVRPC